MTTVLLVIHLMIALALVGVVLIQRSEGGALGIGGGGGFMTGRGAANLLTRITAILAALFFATSILMTVLARHGGGGTSLFKDVKTTTEPQGRTGNDGAADKRGDVPLAPAPSAAPAPAPSGPAPSAPAPSAAPAPAPSGPAPSAPAPAGPQ